jgi:hypothetical protein
MTGSPLRVAAETPPAKSVVWVEDPYAWVEKNADEPKVNLEAILTTSQAVNEREHASFVVKAKSPLGSVQVKVSPLLSPDQHRIEPSQVQVREVKWLAPAAGGGYSDSSWVTKEPMPELLEDVTAPLQLEAGEARHIWLTVSTHRILPGKYEGRVEIMAGEDLIATLPLSVRVWDIKLPLHPSIIVNQWESLPAPAKLAEKYGAFAHEHYDNTRLINYPDAKQGQLDWNHWDWMDRARVMGKHKMKVIIDLRRVPSQFAGPVRARIDSFVEKHTGVPFDRVLKEMNARLIEAGVPQQNIYICPFDEVETDSSEVLATFKNIKTIVPDMKTILCTGGAKDIIRWLEDNQGRFSEIQQYVDAYLIDKAVLSRAFELENDVEIFKQSARLYRRAIPLEAKYGFDTLFDSVADAAKLDADTQRLSDWFRAEQRKGKEVFWYWNHWRCAMVKNNQYLFQGQPDPTGQDERRIPGTLEAQRFSFWKTWCFDLDGGTEGSGTGIWHHEWTYFDQTIEIDDQTFSTARDRELYRMKAQGKPVFTWQPPERQMLHLVEHVRVLSDGDFRMVSSKRFEAFSDGVRDYLYLGSLEQLAQRGLLSKGAEVVDAAQEALRVLSVQYKSGLEHPYHRHTYQAAKEAFIAAILRLQKHGMAIEVDQQGGLIRHRRHRAFFANPAIDSPG